MGIEEKNMDHFSLLSRDRMLYRNFNNEVAAYRDFVRQKNKLMTKTLRENVQLLFDKAIALAREEPHTIATLSFILRETRGSLTNFSEKAFLKYKKSIGIAYKEPSLFQEIGGVVLAIAGIMAATLTASIYIPISIFSGMCALGGMAMFYQNGQRRQEKAMLEEMEDKVISSNKESRLAIAKRRGESVNSKVEEIEDIAGDLITTSDTIMEVLLDLDNTAHPRPTFSQTLSSLRNERIPSLR